MKNNQLRQAAALLLLTGGLLTTISARADTVTLAPFDAFGNATFGLTHSTGSFVDDFLFTISPAMIGHASGTSVVGATWMMPAPADNYAISDIKFFTVNPDSSHTDITTTFNASTLRFYANGPLAAGNYGFEVTGMSTLAGLGGSYAGNLNVMTTPVPEPASFAMLGLGLGMLGLARRRQKQDKFS
jgi:hypothetical protein